MIGILLNYLKNATKSITNVESTPVFVRNILGNGTKDYTVESGTNLTVEQLSQDAGTLAFRNLTISKDASLVPVNYYTNGVKSPGPYSTISLQCSGTLTIEGHINADGYGDTGTRGTTISNISKIPLEYQTALGQSATSTNYTRLQQYAYTNSLLHDGAWIVGGGGLVYYNPARTISTGWEGGAGGFVALYFKHLYIDGKKYGYESCDLTKISANGITSIQNTIPTTYLIGYGGGCIIIAANTINITSTGKISADGTLSTRLIQPITGTNYSLLNNLPQLGHNQRGFYWDDTQHTYVSGLPTSRTYYYDDGTGNGVCNKHIASGNSVGCGGAGIAIGIKL